MTDKEKLEKIKQLADTMYNKMQNLTTDASGTRKAMEDYHQFIIYQYYKEEPVSEDLEEAANDYAHDLLHDEFETFIAGAKWQKEHLWKPADGDDLPEIDREVIVLYQPYPCEGNEYAVSFAHRPQEYWETRNTKTDEVIRYYPKRYDKGGWNIPDVKWWLDLEFPIQKGE